MAEREMVGTFLYLPMERVHHGRGAVTKLAGEADRLGAERVLVVTSPSIVRATDAIARLQAQLGSRLVHVFDGVRPHVPYSCLQPGLDAVYEWGPDLLVSVGGGSCVDAARALALSAGEDLRDVTGLAAFRAQFAPPHTTTIPATSGRALPHIAVPTTLSAAEFANAGAVTSEARHVKDLLIADELTPRVVILDPELAVQTPLSVWSSTGMRALDHAVESVYSPNGGPVSDTLSLAAIRDLAAALRAAYADPADIAARERAQVAAWMSYFGEMNLTLGLSHAIGHQLGARFGMQHGLTSCIVLPHVMRFLAPVVRDRLALVAGALGVEAGSRDTQGAAEAAAAAVEQLVRDLGLPSRLHEVGVTSADFPELADAVLADLVVAGSPRPVTKEQVVEILGSAS
ncbi:MAG TPA: iron-containing alcohol dehydrogenase [Intrasporangium sp.]|uniref:iron-containing alcohol dehydrogenase n=1 Tax=Intrasporangium sp. TaxID=1925024 RepID=UPI002D79FC4A|nr:iron-containing alcohol dehydrogenase [Intrasporangium sp.]HET7397386.1 iron-containing alcohol dehydrogenase [Intrasporangium sp.]